MEKERGNMYGEIGMICTMVQVWTAEKDKLFSAVFLENARKFT